MPNPYLIIGALVFSLVLAVASFGAGHHYAALQEQKAIAAAVTDAKNKQAAEDRVNENSAVAEAQAQAKIAARKSQLQNEASKYVPQNLPPLSLGVVELLNDSARDGNILPPPAGQSINASSGVRFADAISTIAGNNAKYLACSEKLTALQNWARQISTASAKGN